MNLTPVGLKILLFLARNPQAEFYIREIAEKLSLSVGGTHMVLKTLNQQNFIKKRKSGKNLYYHINDDNPAILNFKIFMNIYELTTIVEEIKDITEKIILFGSCATGEDTNKSDIDLLILTQHKKEVAEYLNTLMLERKIQPVIVTATELVKIKENDLAFYKEFKKGITLWDNTHE